VVAIDGPRLTCTAAGKKKTIEDKPFTITVQPGVTLIKNLKVVPLSQVQVGDRLLIEAEQFAIGRELFYAGDEVAAVAADTEEHARDAARALRIDYEVLDHMVHEHEVIQNKQKRTVPAASNYSEAKGASQGDIEAGLREADAVVEATYGVPVISHQCLESHGLVAEWQADGSLTVWASTQATVSTAQQLAARYGLPPAKVNCITHYMGGGFGSKFGPDVQGFAAADLALRTDAPVKIMLDREGEVLAAGNRPSARGTVKIGGKKDGTITAYIVDCYGTPGYTGGATVNLNLLPYVYLDAIPNWKRSHAVVYTNAGAARAIRAPGHPQNCILTEFAIDDLAARLGIDPILMRRKNLPPNNPNAPPNSWAARRNTIYNQQIDIALQLSGWKEKWHPPGRGNSKGPLRHGLGIALHTWGGFAAAQTNECFVIISRDGSIVARTSTQDLGTGQRTATAIVVAEILGQDPAAIITEIGESRWGLSSGSGGSTTCPSQAPAALRAAQAARDELFAKVAPRVQANPADLAIEPGKIVDRKTGRLWTWREFCAHLGMDQVRGRGEWSLGLANEPENENISSGQVGGVQVAEVTVDVETGLVRVLHLVAVQDCGLVVNRLTCESQVAGGVIMGLNYALFEECIRDAATGRQLNPDMEFYKLGGLGDMPKITVHLQDMPERGVIGVGEPPVISTAAAVGNAVFNALGIRVPFLPITPWRVLQTLAQRGKTP
jgi:xanthine dehydrogenase YagR molybdenum-binding subunit